MRKNIHPQLKNSKIQCACGNVVETRSILGSHKIDICNECHPFFTGKQKFVDTEGRLERFKRKYNRA